MPTSWSDFYRGRLLSDGYRRYAAGRYAPFLAEIVSRIRPGDIVAEIGCGLGTMTALLVELVGRSPLWRCFDACPEMVDLARANLRGRHSVALGDARRPTGATPAVVHSHGMLEHMADDEIRAVIAAHRADGARAAVHYVPGDKYPAPSFGDERLMSLDRWRDIAAPTSGYSFNDGFDHVLVWDFEGRST